MKICSTCKVEKLKIEFGKNTNSKDGLKSQCRKCRSDYQKSNKDHIDQYNKDYYVKNSDDIRMATKSYYENNKDIIILKQAEYVKKNAQKTKAYYKRYKKTRYHNDHIYAMRERLGALIRAAITGSGYSKKSKTQDILGCTYEEFCVHIESLFIDGMNWDNRELWHIDHIYPLSKAIDEDHLLELNKYTNLQPLWAEDNIKKGNKIMEPNNV